MEKEYHWRWILGIYRLSLLQGCSVCFEFTVKDVLIQLLLVSSRLPLAAMPPRHDSPYALAMSAKLNSFLL